MADFTPAPSQENAPLSSQPSSTGGDTNSSPILPTLERQKTSKPCKAPTITPRSFTRFFTPKSSLERGGRIGASRQALRDITASASNRKGRRTPAEDTIQILEDEMEGQVYASKKRKRKVRISVVTPELSSPLKRIWHQSLGASDGEESHTDTTASEDESEEALKASRGRGPARLSTTKPIILSRYRSVLGYTLQREIGCLVRKPAITRSDRGMCTAKDWQYETANFSASPRDGYTCLNLSSPGERSIPFCTASCNRTFCDPFVMQVLIDFSRRELFGRHWRRGWRRPASRKRQRRDTPVWQSLCEFPSTRKCHSRSAILTRRHAPGHSIRRSNRSHHRHANPDCNIQPRWPYLFSETSTLSTGKLERCCNLQ